MKRAMLEPTMTSEEINCAKKEHKKALAEAKAQKDNEAIKMFTKEIDALDKKDVKKITHDDIHFLADRIWGHQFKEEYKRDLLRKLEKIHIKVYRYYNPGINTPMPLLRKYTFQGFRKGW